MKIWKILLLCTFVLSLLTGCVTSRYTNPNLTISPDFRELQETGKTMQIIIADQDSISLVVTKGLFKNSRKEDNALEQFNIKLDKYFDWHIKDISTLKRVKFFDVADTNSYDYTLVIQKVHIMPNLVYPKNDKSNSLQIGLLSVNFGKLIVDGLLFDIRYKIIDNNSGSTVLKSWKEADNYHRGYSKKFDESVKSKDWSNVIRGMAREVIFNSPFYSKEKEDKLKNKYYDFNKKSNFQN